MLTPIVEYKFKVQALMDLARRFRSAPSDLYDTAYKNLEQECYHALRTRVEGHIVAPIMPDEEMWGGLARDLVFWMQITPGAWTGTSLHKCLKRKGTPIPEWLAKEIPDADSSPSKGTIVSCIYLAMTEHLANAVSKTNCPT